MRRHLTYANVAATLALFFALSGGALAAKHYLITSTKQIDPKVLKKLRGRAGKTGAHGVTGPAGAIGGQGAAGKEGPKGEAGPTSHAYTNNGASLTSVKVPAGSYLVTADGDFIAQAKERNLVGTGECFLEAP